MCLPGHWTGLVSPVTAVWWWWLVQGTVVVVVQVVVLVYQAQSDLVSGPVHIVTVTVTTFCFRCVTTRGKMDAAVTRQQGDT